MIMPKINVQDTQKEMFIAEWKIWSVGCFLSVLVASVLLTGWPQGVIPNLKYPIEYGGDALVTSWQFERVIEGWVFENSRNGYPFGSDFYDFPGADAGSLLIAKALGLLFGGWLPALNLYILASFPIVFLFSYLALRSFGINRHYSFTGAFLYTFIPFHIIRLTHTFYLWYFVVPVCFSISLKLFNGDAIELFKKPTWASIARTFFISIVLASFGVYYAFFGVLTIATAGLAAFLKGKGLKSTQKTIGVVGLICLGVLLNLSPNVSYRLTKGKNPEVAQRLPAESEIYALKLRQLVLPRIDHRIGKMSSLTRQYTVGALTGYYEWSVPLGLIGAIGFTILGFVIIFSLTDKEVDRRLKLLALLTWILFLFGTIGGLGAMFAGLISPMIRGWDRISIFIGFGAIAGFFIFLQSAVENKCHKSKKAILPISSAVLLLLGVLDQSVPAPKKANYETEQTYLRDREFVLQIERLVPPGSAIYQIPYMPFPESPYLFRLPSYDHAKGFLHSRTLKWSWGGMVGREGDLFFRTLSKEPIKKQLEVIARLGFSGLYIDRRGFSDNGHEVIEQVRAILGNAPELTRSDGEIVFFQIKPEGNSDFSDLSPRQIMEKAGFIVDRLGTRYKGAMSEGIDFSRPDWPDFVTDAKGFSNAEHGGRWTDANLNPSAAIEFSTALPNKFTLEFLARPFGPNIGERLLIRIGRIKHYQQLPEGSTKVQIKIDLQDKVASTVEFVPPFPSSPIELGISQDSRKLGVALSYLRITE